METQKTFDYELRAEHIRHQMGMGSICFMGAAVCGQHISAE